MNLLKEFAADPTVPTNATYNANIKNMNAKIPPRTPYLRPLRLNQTTFPWFLSIKLRDIKSKIKKIIPITAYEITLCALYGKNVEILPVSLCKKFKSAGRIASLRTNIFMYSTVAITIETERSIIEVIQKRLVIKSNNA